MSRRRWIGALLTCALAGLLAASVMSFLDWRLNPGGIFHGPAGTDWRVVWETWFSWFYPVFLLTGALTIPAVIWWPRRSR